MSFVLSNHGPAVSLRDVSLSLRQGRVMKNVLKGIDLELHPGKLHFLVGPNGCGKSTLLRLLAGVYRADHGVVRTLSPIGFVLQNPDHQVVMPTVASDVAFSLGDRSRSETDVKALVESALRSVDMLEFFDSPISTLSGGKTTV